MYRKFKHIKAHKDWRENQKSVFLDVEFYGDSNLLKSVEKC